MASLDWKRLSVLVVEDNRYMAALIQAILRSVGVRNINIQEDSAQALHELNQYGCDVALVDIVMENIDGIAFTKAVRASKEGADPFLPIVLVSGLNDAGTARRALNAGANGLVIKPLVPASLLTHVARTLLAPKPFVRTSGFFGPSRRRTRTPAYYGHERRSFC